MPAADGPQRNEYTILATSNVVGAVSTSALLDDADADAPPPALAVATDDSKPSRGADVFLGAVLLRFENTTSLDDSWAGMAKSHSCSISCLTESDEDNGNVRASRRGTVARGGLLPPPPRARGAAACDTATESSRRPAPQVRVSSLLVACPGEGGGRGATPRQEDLRQCGMQEGELLLVKENKDFEGRRCAWEPPEIAPPRVSRVGEITMRLSLLVGKYLLLGRGLLSAMPRDVAGGEADQDPRRVEL